MGEDDPRKLSDSLDPAGKPAPMVAGFPLLPSEREYYKAVHGFDPVDSRLKGPGIECRYEAWFDLPNDPPLAAAGVKIAARVDFTEGEIHNRIIFRREDQETEVDCTHTVIYTGPLEEALTFVDDAILKHARSVAEQKKLAETGGMVILPPWGHFASLKSFVGGISETGIKNIFHAIWAEEVENRDTSPKFDLTFGFNSEMQHQILSALRQLVPAAIEGPMRDHILQLAEDAPLEWLAARWDVLNDQYGLYGLLFRNSRIYMAIDPQLRRKILRALRTAKKAAQPHGGGFLFELLDVSPDEGEMIPHLDEDTDDAEGISSVLLRWNRPIPPNPTDPHGYSATFIAECEESYDTMQFRIRIRRDDGHGQVKEVVLGSRGEANTIPFWSVLQDLPPLNVFRVLKGYVECLLHVDRAILEKVVSSLLTPAGDLGPDDGYFDVFGEMEDELFGDYSLQYEEEVQIQKTIGTVEDFNEPRFEDPVLGAMPRERKGEAWEFIRQITLMLARTVPSEWFVLHWWIFDFRFNARKIVFHDPLTFQTIDAALQSRVFRKIAKKYRHAVKAIWEPLPVMGAKFVWLPLGTIDASTGVKNKQPASPPANVKKFPVRLEDGHPALRIKYETLSRLADLGGLDDLQDLEILVVKSCGIYDLEDIPPLPRLRVLKLERNQIEHVPGLTKFPLLEELHLEGNRLHEIPDLSDLPHLRVLHLRGYPGEENRIRDTGNLAALPILEDLDLSENLLTSPPSLRQHPALRKLNLAGNQITAEHHWDDAPSLNDLDLSRNHLTHVPLFGQMPVLKELCLANNQIPTVDALGKFIALEKLDLGKNPIKDIKRLFTLNSLTKLRLAGTQVADLAGIHRLRRLEQLDISETLVGTIEYFEEMRNLRWLCVEDSKLQGWAEELLIEWADEGQFSDDEFYEGLAQAALDECDLRRRERLFSEGLAAFRQGLIPEARRLFETASAGRDRESLIHRLNHEAWTIYQQRKEAPGRLEFGIRLAEFTVSLGKHVYAQDTLACLLSATRRYDASRAAFLKALAMCKEEWDYKQRITWAEFARALDALGDTATRAKYQDYIQPSKR